MQQKKLDGTDAADVLGDIQKLFKRHKQITVRELAEKVIDSDILDEDKKHSLLLVGVEDLCRKALKEKRADGLPLAQPISGGNAAPWKLLDVFNYADMEALIQRRIESLGNDYEELLKLWRYCAKRFGKAPELPKLVQLETA
jgi:hypothetical protein